MSTIDASVARAARNPGHEWSERKDLIIKTFSKETFEAWPNENVDATREGGFSPPAS